MYKAFLLVFVIITYAFPSLQIKISQDNKAVRIHLASRDSFVYKGKEALPGGVIFNLSGQFNQNSQKLIQAPINSSLVKEYIFQPLSGNNYQFILNRLAFPDAVFAHYSVDSLYHLHIFIYDKKWLSKDPTALYLQGLLYESKGYPIKAIQFYRKAIKIAGRHGNAYYRAGIIRLNQGRIRDAEINFNKALKQNTDSIGVYLYLAKLYERKGQRELAQQYRKKYEMIQTVWSKLRQPETVRSPVPEKTEKDKPAMARGNLTPYILAGLFLILLVIAFWVYRIKKTSAMQEDVEQEEEVLPEELSEREKEFLELLKQKKTEIESPPEEMMGKSTRNLEESLVEEKSFPVDEEELSESEEDDEKVQKAKEMNVGIGELDLALNLRAKMRNKNKLTSQEDLILEMYRDGMKKEEIARKLQLNYGEVDLVIELNKHKLKS